MELVACNIDDPLGVDELTINSSEARFFPNPLNSNSVLNVQTEQPIECPDEIAVYDLLGKKTDVQVTQTGDYNLKLNFAGKRPGIYFVHIETRHRTVVGKIAYTP
jgi:hypothetical protein